MIVRIGRHKFIFFGQLVFLALFRSSLSSITNSNTTQQAPTQFIPRVLKESRWNEIDSALNSPSEYNFCLLNKSTALSTRIYRGLSYVYTFSTDPPPSEFVKSYLRQLTRASEISASTNTGPVFVTIAGSLAGLNFLAAVPEGTRKLSRIIFCDKNPWTLSYAKFIVALIKLCHSREEFLSRLFNREAPAVPLEPSREYQLSFFLKADGFSNQRKN